MVYALIGCFIVIGFLGFKLAQKHEFDKELLSSYNKDLYLRKQYIEDAKQELEEIKKEIRYTDDIIKHQKREVDEGVKRLNELTLSLNSKIQEREYEEYKLEECKKDLQTALDTYHDITDNKLREIDTTIEE